MKFPAVFLALAIGVMGQNGTISYTTITTTSFTTYCPEATILNHGGVIYNVTEATTLTITDCPCTLTKPVVIPTSTVLYTSCPPSSSSPAAVTRSIAPASSISGYVNLLTPIYSTGAPTKVSGFAGANSTTASVQPLYTGAASINKAGRLVIGTFAGLIALAL